MEVKFFLKNFKKAVLKNKLKKIIFENLFKIFFEVSKNFFLSLTPALFTIPFISLLLFFESAKILFKIFKSLISPKNDLRFFSFLNFFKSSLVL